MTVPGGPRGGPTRPQTRAGLAAVRAAVADGAPDPADALRRLERIDGAAAATDDALTILRLTCQRAPYLATLLARDPARLARVAADPYLRREKPLSVMKRELGGILGDRAPGERELGGAPGQASPGERAADAAGATLDPEDDPGLAAHLRRFRADELVRLGARELGLGSPIEVGAELAHLADACLDAAIDHHLAALARRHGRPRYLDEVAGIERDAELAVIGMGKLGGEELNFASDIDVIYVYSSDAGETDGGSWASR